MRSMSWSLLKSLWPRRKVAGLRGAAADPSSEVRNLALGSDNILFAVDWPYEPNTAGIEFLKNLPVKMSQIARLASYGSWLNFFMCDALVSGVKEQFGPNPTGVPVTAARCQ